MEITKRKEELMAFLEFNANNTGAGIALRNFLRDSSNSPHYEDSFMDSKSTQDEEGSSAGSSEEPEEGEETIEEVRENEEARDDEDFIMLVAPKGKKKPETKKITKPSSNKPSNSKKRKCEFCGTVETPMWRRGPTGKGTLCNACGVKWSLKFRKRAGKKSSKSDRNKDEPREQRQSTRKKIPTKKSIALHPNVPEGELPKEEEQPHQHVGLCCNHALRRKRAREDDIQEPSNKKIQASNDEDSFSDEAPMTNVLLGRLLNVVEVQLVEEEELDRVKKQMKELRADLELREELRNKQFNQTKMNTLFQLMEFRREVSSLTSDNDQEKIVQSCTQVLQDFGNNMKNQLDELKLSLGVAATNGMGKKIDRFQSEIIDMQAKMEANFTNLRAMASSNVMQIDKILNIKEDNLRSELASLKQESDQDFAAIHRRVDTMEDSLESP